MQAALSSGDSTKEAQLLEIWKAYKKGFQQGIALFNVKPKKGVAYLQVHSLFQIKIDSVHCGCSRLPGVLLRQHPPLLWWENEMGFRCNVAVISAWAVSLARRPGIS